jgi:hypothetical protein
MRSMRPWERSESEGRRKAYREFVHSNRDKEEQEIKEKMGKGVIGVEGFQAEIEKRAINARRPRKGRPKK